MKEIGFQLRNVKVKTGMGTCLRRSSIFFLYSLHSSYVFFWSNTKCKCNILHTNGFYFQISRGPSHPGDHPTQGTIPPRGPSHPGDHPTQGTVPPRGPSYPGDRPTQGTIPPRGPSHPGDHPNQGTIPPRGQLTRYVDRFSYLSNLLNVRSFP